MTSCRHWKCACVQFKEGGESNCRMVVAGHWRGLARSKTGFTAYVREGATPFQLAGRKADQNAPCIALNKQALRPTGLWTVPRFFLHQRVYNEAALAECYERRRHRVWNWSSDAAAWLHTALESHPKIA